MFLLLWWTINTNNFSLSSFNSWSLIKNKTNKQWIIDFQTIRIVVGENGFRGERFVPGFEGGKRSGERVRSGSGRSSGSSNGSDGIESLENHIKRRICGSIC